MALLNRDDLRELTQAEPPCVSLYLPTHRAGAETQQDPIRFKNLLREAEERLDADGDGDEAGEVLEPARALLDDHPFWQHQSDGLAVFLAPGTRRLYRLPLGFEELVVVGERFHLAPLLPLLGGDGTFYVLALSQNRVRLFAATRHRVREVDLRDIPESLADALGYDWEQRSLQFHSSAPRGAGGQAGGGRAPIYHGHGTGTDDEKEEVARFLHLVDNGVRRLLRDPAAPVVVAAVDWVASLYRDLTKLANLVPEAIEGNPDAASAEELHRQALERVEPQFEQERERAAERYAEAAGTGRTGRDVREVVLAAADGRVDTLFVDPNAHCWGRFEHRARRVDVHAGRENGDEDLVDRAALEALLHGGAVYAVNAEAVPGGGELAALYRY